MSSSSLAIKTGALRPGLISGNYPERSDQESHWIERLGSQLQGTLAHLSIDRHRSLHQVVAKIDQHGDGLTALEQPQLDSLLVNLRRQFRSCGLSTPLCIEAFALIRETSKRTIQLRHYESQLMGGWSMLHGQLAEMETGEGKTLAATLAAATAALAGIPTHVITVNEYLVERDAKTMGALYRALGLTVGYVTQEMDDKQRRAAYRCDITYCTNKQVAFDYLRDRLVLGNERSKLRLQLEAAYADNNRSGQFLLRGLCFAIIDEADSVLIDEARTPLILTRSVDSTAEHTTYRLTLHLAQKLGIPQQDIDKLLIKPTNKDVEEYLKKQIARFPELKWEQLQNGPMLAFDHEEIAYADLIFPTPSGKIELWSEQARERWGVNELPTFTEPKESIVNTQKYPLYLMTPNTKNRIHSQFGNLQVIKMFDPKPYLIINPKDAALRSIKDSENVEVFNDRGKIKLPVRYDYGIKRGCVVLYNGWWISEGASANFLSAPRETDMGHGAAFHDNMVQVKAEVINLTSQTKK